MKVSRLSPPRAREFLAAPEVPAGPALRAGDRVRVLRARSVARVGYRLSARELLPEARGLIEGPEGGVIREALGAAGCTVPDADLGWFVARGLVLRRSFGGPERGVVLEAEASSWAAPGEEDRVEAVRFARLGTRYPPSGGYDSWTGESEYEPGGLTGTATARICRLGGFEALSGDLELVRAAPRPPRKHREAP